MSLASSQFIVVGCGAMGRALAFRLASLGGVPWLVSRRRAASAAVTREVPGSREAPDLGRALAAAPDAPIFITVESASAARDLIAASATLSALAGRRVFIALYDVPSALDALVQVLESAGALPTVVGFVATPAVLRSGQAPLLTDAAPGSVEADLLAHLGTCLCAGSPRAAAHLTLMSPLLYASLTALHAWAVGWCTRNGLPPGAWFESAQGDPLLAHPVDAFHTISAGAPVGGWLTTEGLSREWGRVAAASPDLGIDARLPRALMGLLEGCAAGPLDRCLFRHGTREGHPDAATLAGELAERAVVSSTGVPSRLVGVGFQLVLSTVAASVARLHPPSVALLAEVLAAIPVLRDPVGVGVMADRVRWRRSLYAEPIVPVDLLVTELRHAVTAVEMDPAARAWAQVVTQVYEDTAAGRQGPRADFTAVYETVTPPRWSARKRAALDDTRQFISPGRVAFFEQVGVPFVMGRRDGSFLADIDDSRVLLNLHCNGGVFNFGHRPEDIMAAMTEAAGQVDIGNHHLISERRGRLARRLAGTMPDSLSRVAFGPSATEMTDFAIRLSRAHTGRRRILSFEGSFHGTAGTGAQAGDPRFFAWAGPRAPEFSTVERWDLDAVARELQQEDVALVLAETVQASSGMHLPPVGFYRELSALCRASGTLLALDEVQTGWGRTGRLWGFEHFDVVPDLVILGKGMSGGVYPMAACGYDPRIANALEVDPFVHQSTGGGSELGCRVTERILDLVEAPDFLPRVAARADRFARGLDAVRQRVPVVTRVHQLGLFISVGLASPQLGPLVTKACFDRGLLVMFSGLSPDFVQVLPPLTITDGEVEWALARFEEGVRDAWELAQAIAAQDTIGRRARPTPDDRRAPAPRLLAPDAAPPAAGFTSGLCATMDPRLPDVMRWSPGDGERDAVRVVRVIPGLNADVSVVEIASGTRREPYVMKPLPGFAPEWRFDEYAALLEEYVTRLRRAGILCLDTWMVCRGSRRTAWVVQPALPSESLLTARLPHLSDGARRAVFRRIVGCAQAALAAGCGLDPHLANWALPSPHDLDPVMLDVTQPLLRDDRGRIRMAYGAAGVPLFVERRLSALLSSDLFDLRPLLLDMVANLRLAPALAVYEPSLRAAVVDETGVDLPDGELARMTTKVMRMRGALKTLRSLFGDARLKPA